MERPHSGGGLLTFCGVIETAPTTFAPGNQKIALRESSKGEFCVTHHGYDLVLLKFSPKSVHEISSRSQKIPHGPATYIKNSSRSAVLKAFTIELHLSIA